MLSASGCSALLGCAPSLKLLLLKYCFGELVLQNSFLALRYFLPSYSTRRRNPNDSQRTFSMRPILIHSRSPTNGWITLNIEQWVCLWGCFVDVNFDALSQKNRAQGPECIPGKLFRQDAKTHFPALASQVPLIRSSSGWNL